MYEIQEVDINTLSLNENNPRFIRDKDFQHLVKSLQECPELFQARPLLVNKGLMILGGNMRYRAAQELKYKQVPVIILNNLTPEQEREIIIKDNGSFGNWDFSELANGWSDLPLDEWGIDMPNFLEEEEPTDLIGEDSNKPPVMKITFTSPEQLQKAEIDIQELLDRKYAGAYFSVSAGEI
jgi:ParB-like chromosome segregation protein Spo0J